MASLLANHSFIEVVKTKSGNTELTNTINEAAGQTLVLGTPVQVNAQGNVQAWDGVTINSAVAGISEEDAHNLSVAGAGAPTAFTTVGFPGTGSTFGKVPNQSAGVNIAEGAPFSLGMLTFAEANLDTIFRGQTDNSTGAATTPTQASVGNQFGLTIDANGHWFIDFAKIVPGNNTVVEIIGLDPIDGSIANARVLFQFLKSACQFVQ